MGTTMAPSFTAASQRSMTATRLGRQNATRSPAPTPRAASTCASSIAARFELAEGQRTCRARRLVDVERRHIAAALKREVVEVEQGHRELNDTAGGASLHAHSHANCDLAGVA